MDAYTVAKEYYRNLEGFEVAEIMNGRAIDIVLTKQGATASETVSKVLMENITNQIVVLDTITERLTKELDEFLRGIN